MTTHKVFNDPIHGTVELHPLLVKIIDTPQFQRLRYLKQLGGVYYVYPGASHNRFEHLIGVAHLAGELVTALRTRQPELNIDERDVLCVQIAGLCHDLGHGPFSHLFETFIHKARPEKKDWKHEKASLEMFDYLVADNGLKPVMEKHGLVLSEDQDFIKELIGGPLDTVAARGQKWPYKGRPKDKSFLYEIVANKRNGIDVDKFDYLARDAHHLGIQTNFDHRRFIKFARVCEDGQKQICTRDKEVNNLYELFNIRHTLHRKAYQHSVNKIIESMITTAFLKADEHIQIQGSGGKMFTLSTAIDDMKAYTKLTDHVYERILNSSTSELDEAKAILKKIVARKHPRCLGERTPTEEVNNLYELFQLRHTLHRRACYHSVNKIIESMITTAFLKADEHIQIQGSEGEKLTLSTALTAYEERLSDLDEAKDILSKIVARKHPRCLGERTPTEDMITEWKSMTPEAVVEMKRDWQKDLADCQDDRLTPEDFEVHIIELDYGKKDKNPVDEMRFYKKRKHDEAFKLPEHQKSKFDPKFFSEWLIRVYYKKTDEESVKKAYERMELWCIKVDLK